MDQSQFDLKAQYIRCIDQKFGHRIPIDTSRMPQGDWPTFLQGLSDLQRFLDDDDLLEAGRFSVSTAPYKGLIQTGDLLYNLPDQFVSLFGESGFIATALPITTSCYRSGPNTLVVEITLSEPASNSQPLLMMLKGQLEHLPCVLGRDGAEVTATYAGRRAIFEVVLSKRSLARHWWTHVRQRFSGRLLAKRLHDSALEQVRLIRYLTAAETTIQMQTPNPEDATNSRLVNSTLDGIVTLNDRGQVTYANPAFILMSGYPKTEIVGLPIRRIMPGLADLTENLTLNQTSCHRLDGTVFSVSVTSVSEQKVSPTKTAGVSDDPTIHSLTTNSSITLVVRDLTEANRSERIQRQLSSRLQASQKMDSVGQLTGGIVHDFNNLLLAIRGHAELALGDEQATAQSLTDIIAATNRGSGLTRRLLDYSRKSTVDSRRVDLKSVIENTITLVHPLLPENINLMKSLPEQPVTVVGDEHQLEQILMNLIVNARDAMATGGDCGIKLSLSGAVAMLEISDSGEGMTNEVKARIFEPMFTTKPTGTGTGLGLAVVSDILRSMDGTVEVTSSPGQGTTMTLLMPLARNVPRASRNKKADTQMSNNPDLASGTHTVLIVEDNPEIQELTRLMLKGAGYRVLTASDGAQALEVLESENSVDAVLLDVVLPVMGGRETAERIALTAPGSKLLFMSAYPLNSPPLEFVRDQALPFIAKPFGTLNIRLAVEELLQPAAQLEKQQR